MANGTLGIEEPNSIDKKIDAEQLEVGGQTVYRERVQITGEGDTDIANVSAGNGLEVDVTTAPDPWIEHAKRVIFANFGVNVTLEAKNKDLLKFGRNADVETEIATIMTLPDGIDNETYVASNLITTISSDDTDDTEVMKIEGHTISGTDLTFLVQTATLNGQNQVTLGTPLARCTRAYANGSTDLVGTIYVYEDDTDSSGVPVTDAGVHLMIRAGKNQSEKASTSLSSVDFWIITNFHADMLTKAASFAEVDLEVRLAGKVFRQVDDISCSDSHAGDFPFKPYLIVPPNSDVRLRGVSDNASGRDISASIEGVLLKAAS